MFSPAEIYDLIEERRRELGISQADLGARAFGKADNTAVQSIRKGSAPSIERLAAIARALDLELYLGRPRELTPAPSTVVDGERFETVERFDAAGSAGGGALNLDGPPVDHLAFSKRWLSQNGISAGSSFLINVAGDSMEPSLYDGDLVMIDKRKTQVRSGRIYALRDGDALRIKRVELIPGTALILRSDNPAHAPEHRVGDAMNAIKVLGEVVWSGHTWI